MPSHKKTGAKSSERFVKSTIYKRGIEKWKNSVGILKIFTRGVQNIMKTWKMLYKQNLQIICSKMVQNTNAKNLMPKPVRFMGRIDYVTLFETLKEWYLTFILRRNKSKIIFFRLIKDKCLEQNLFIYSPADNSPQHFASFLSNLKFIPKNVKVRQLFSAIPKNYIGFQDKLKFFREQIMLVLNNMNDHDIYILISFLLVKKYKQRFSG